MNTNLKRLVALSVGALTVSITATGCVILPPSLPDWVPTSTSPTPHPGRDSGDKEEPSATGEDDRTVNGDACAQLVNNWYSLALDPAEIQYTGSVVLDDVIAGEEVACTITITNPSELTSGVDGGFEELTVAVLTSPSAELDSKVAEFARNEGMIGDESFNGQTMTGGNVVESFWAGELPEENATSLPPEDNGNWVYSNNLLQAKLSSNISEQAAKDQFQAFTGIALDGNSQMLLYGHGWQPLQ